MKKILIWSGIIALTVIAVMLVLYFSGRSVYTRFITAIAQLVEKSTSKSQGISTISSFDAYKKLSELRFSDTTNNAVFKLDLENPLVLGNDETTTILFSVPNDGEYAVVIKYRYDNFTTSSGTLEFEVEKKTYLGILDNFTYYDFNEKVYDRYGNEITPEQKPFEGTYLTFVKDASRISHYPLLLKLNAGENLISVKNTRSPIVIEGIYLVAGSSLFVSQPYAEYRSVKRHEGKSGEDIIVIEAEGISFKSDSLISLTNEQTALVTPYEILRRKINVIDETTFKQSGQEIFWSFYVETPGYYKIAFRYKQATNRGIPIFRRIYLDGKVPFKEFVEYPFPYTGYTWKDYVLKNEQNEPLEVYLDKGFHILSMEVTTGMYEDTIKFLQNSVKKLQEIGLELRKLVGNNLDPNRTWNIEKYMPNAVPDLTHISQSLKAEHEKLVGIVGKQGLPSIADMLVCAGIIDNILRKPEKLPFYIDVLSEGASSIAQRLSELSMRLKEQPMGIDKIYVFQGSLDRFAYPKSTFLITAYEELQKLWLSLFNKNEAYSIYEKVDEASLRVWVNRPVQYVETLQYLTDSDFTRKTGIKVIFSIMPNEQKLVLASAANTVPDVAMSISNWIPFELAIRNALFPLSYFPDFFTFAEKNINVETLLPMVVDDKVYGITETQNFYVLFYRKDIIEKLSIPIPDTWDDVKKILPELQRRGMNFSIPMCEQTTKYFNTTGPFFFQNKARLYTKDGMKTAINEENSVKAFELMTDLFAIYGIPEQVASFYNSFRYGRIPIGVGDFGLYVTLLNAADEIYGLWDIAPSPGVRTENGEILRYQVAGDRAIVIFANSNKKEKAWEFIKWWMSKDTQVKFARMMVNRYGPTYLWNTANIEAFKELDFIDEKHKKVILEQWKWIREVQRHPGGYMVEREVSNIWNSVVIEGKPLRTSIDRSVILINRELERKLTEFGYIINGKKIKDYRMYDSMEEFIETVINRGEGESTTHH
ncbi:ABC-type glycerol-3-phosphate transport system, substrate-binding protein [Fervidobacterium changbaicum]|uniref:Extracellular solute-binding protein n=2 Tax=Fervidobacterium TaxID=2422 RepID=A0AAI8CKJ3_FERIS|nr:MULTISPECIES: extracellular solute-binding protein [Fervidobacterium]AMW32283.1 extracellular solute-binding protein [Fervidobacterium islandicum]QAV32373.1 ABC transporter substrate-binding protein [Fervidobacterium changbaicum]SDH81724.1 ABC-type glycerol-3-phosphate transport system, substrate-binding protein [Fervidobacterium changbaicum]